MPDLRTLLDEASAGTPRSTDPVADVHGVVRRRAARRRTGVAASTTLAVAAGSVALATRPAPRHALTPSATATPSPAPLDTQWRLGDPPLGLSHPVHTDDLIRVRDLAREHPDVFVAVTVQGSDDFPPGWVTAVALADGADPEEWRPRVAAVSRKLPWRFKRCAAPARHYDAIAADVATARWPSGARLTNGPDPHAVFYAPRCTVSAQLDGGALDPRDVAYARARWGDDVRLFAKPVPRTRPTANPDGTHG